MGPPMHVSNTFLPFLSNPAGTTSGSAVTYTTEKEGTDDDTVVLVVLPVLVPLECSNGVPSRRKGLPECSSVPGYPVTPSDFFWHYKL